MGSMSSMLMSVQAYRLVPPFGMVLSGVYKGPWPAHINEQDEDGAHAWACHQAELRGYTDEDIAQLPLPARLSTRAAQDAGYMAAASSVEDAQAYLHAVDLSDSPTKQRRRNRTPEPGRFRPGTKTARFFDLLNSHPGYWHCYLEQTASPGGNVKWLDESAVRHGVEIETRTRRVVMAGGGVLFAVDARLSQ